MYTNSRHFFVYTHSCPISCNNYLSLFSLSFSLAYLMDVFVLVNIKFVVTGPHGYPIYCIDLIIRANHKMSRIVLLFYFFLLPIFNHNTFFKDNTFRTYCDLQIYSKVVDKFVVAFCFIMSFKKMPFSLTDLSTFHI